MKLSPKTVKDLLDFSCDGRFGASQGLFGGLLSPIAQFNGLILDQCAGLFAGLWGE